MGLYYDRQGQPMTLEAWAEALQGNKRVAETALPNGRWVSTVWLGIDHAFGQGPPLIFETMVFPSKSNLSELDCERYATLEGAIAGHLLMVEKWTAEP